MLWREVHIKFSAPKGESLRTVPTSGIEFLELFIEQA